MPRCKLWQTLRGKNVKEKWINLVKRLYVKDCARIKIGNKITNTIQISKGLKQGCCLSPLLFNIYVDAALENWNRKCAGMGIKIGDKNTLHSLLYADDQIVFAQDEEDMEYMLRKLKEEFQSWGLKINFKKTEYMCVGDQAQNLRIEDDEIKACNTFKYLGTMVCSTGTCKQDIDSKIIMGKRATRALHGLLWNEILTLDTKKRLFHSIVENVVLYGAEMWPLTRAVRDRIRTVELDYMRRCLRVTRRDRVRTEEIWKRMNITCSITRSLENKTLQWYGHVRRMTDGRWPRKLTEWSPEGRRRRGRPALSWETYIRDAMADRNLKDGDWEDKALWKQKTANPNG